MKMKFCIFLFIVLLINCNSFTKRCDDYFLSAKRNYISYFKDYEDSLLLTAKGQIDSSLQCDNDLEEKVKMKFTLLLLLKEFDEAKKLAAKYDQINTISPSFSKDDAIAYVSVIECKYKGDKECLAKNVDYLLQNLEVAQNKNDQYYMMYYDLFSYKVSKETTISFIIENPNLSKQQKEMLSEYIEYNDNPLGAYAKLGPLSKPN